MTTKTAILKAIRANCLECSGNSFDEVKFCTVHRCYMHPFRFGKDPAPAKGGKPSNASQAKRLDDGKGQEPVNG